MRVDTRLPGNLYPNTSPTTFSIVFTSDTLLANLRRQIANVESIAGSDLYQCLSPYVLVLLCNL